MIEPGVSSPSLRKNVAWSLVGNVIYAASQWAMLVILAKLTSSLAVGQFALGVALTTPVLLLLSLQLRAAQATDARRAYEFCDYLALRLAMVTLTLAIVVTAALMAGYRWHTVLVVVGIGLAKCIESVTDIFHGLFVRHQRMELIAKSNIVKSVLSLAAFSAGVYFTRDVAWGVAGLVAAWTAMLVGYDIPQAARLARQDPAKHLDLRPRWRGRALLQLIRVTLPLGFAAMLVALNTNLPRYFLEHLSGEQSLGIFAALAYFVVAGSTVVVAVGDSAMPRLANHHASGNLAAYGRLLAWLLVVAAVIGVLGIVVTLLGGRWLLQLVYGDEYAAAADTFVWIMVGGLMTYIAAILSYGLLAARRFSEQLMLLTGVALVMLVACAVLIPKWGLTGAALALLCAATVNALGAASLLCMGSRGRQAGHDRVKLTLGGDEV